MPDPQASAGIAHLVDALPAVVWEADAVDQRMLYVSPRARDLFGHDPETWMLEPAFWEEHVHPDDLARAIAAVDSALADPAPARVRYRFRMADGTWRWIQDSIQAVHDDAGTRRLAGVMVDVGEVAEVPLAPASPLPGILIDNLADGVYYVDADRRISYWNKAAERLTGYRASEVLGRQCWDSVLVHSDADGRILCQSDCPLQPALRDGRQHESLVWLRHADGGRRPVSVSTAPIMAADGIRIEGAVEVFSDASALVRERFAAEAARQDAVTDPLTGLANRRLLESVLVARKDDLDRHRLPFGFLMLDVDHFKRLNDAFGHGAGDAALRVIADALRAGSRQGDIVVRWGGEEFAIVAAQVDADGLCRLAERLLRKVRSARVVVGDLRVPITVSIGGALAHAAEPKESVVTRADQALTTAKQSGRDRFVLNEPVAAVREARTMGVTRPGSRER